MLYNTDKTSINTLQWKQNHAQLKKKQNRMIPFIQKSTECSLTHGAITIFPLEKGWLSGMPQPWPWFIRGLHRSVQITSVVMKFEGTYTVCCSFHAQGHHSAKSYYILLKVMAVLFFISKMRNNYSQIADSVFLLFWYLENIIV